MIRASEVAGAAAALLWLSSEPWYPQQPWIVRADDALILLFALMVAVIVTTAVSRGLERLAPAFAFKALHLRSQERQESIMTTDTDTIAVSPQRRGYILDYAACLLTPGDRDPNTVITMAAPLLDWVAGATDRDDLSARMKAMAHAHWNDQARLSADRSPEPSRLSPLDFLANARAYYAFLTAEAEA